MRRRLVIAFASTLIAFAVVSQRGFAASMSGADSSPVQLVGSSPSVDFGQPFVCPAGQTALKPCSKTRKLTYSIAASTTFGPVAVVTQGAANLDFNLTETTCTGTLSAGSSCYVKATLTPLAPGLRMGAVELFDSSGNLLATSYIFGVGQGPVAAFTPFDQKSLPVSGYSGGFLAVDAVGNIYFVAGSLLAKLDPTTGVQTTVASDLPSNADGIAVDGAGNFFVTANGVVKIAATTGSQTPIGYELNSPYAIAVDGRGNLYVADDWDTNAQGQPVYPRLAEIFAKSGGESTLLGGDDYGLPGIPLCDIAYGVALDSSANAYVSCYNYGPVFESIAGTPSASGDGVIASRQFNGFGEFGAPFGVAVDAAADLYVTDVLFGGLEEVTPGGNDVSLLTGPSAESPLAVDTAGNLFFPTYLGAISLYEATRATGAPLDFGQVSVGSMSAPQSITIQNIGNQPLNAVSPGLVISDQFMQVPGPGDNPDCTTSFSLAPGAICNLSIVFAPLTRGQIQGTATFIDNALNAAPYKTQTLNLFGNGI